MRKIRLLFLSLSVAALAGCTADMDKFTERLDDLEARVAALETLCAQMNEDISSMRTVISALEDGLYITDVKNVSDGYRIEFSDGETITIRHGRDGEDGVPGTPGADGQDGYTPVIGVRMDTDGIYYWTLDGEWLLDDQGNKMRVTGEDGADGKDGVTPVIGVAQDEDGIYYWTINGEWLLDENGNKVQAQYLGGADSEELIEDIVVDDMGITFILSDGSELYIPLYEAITITFDAEDLLVMEPGSERDIHYTIESRLEDIRIEVLSSSDIRARVVPTDAFTGVINIRTGSSLDEYSKVVVFATNGEKMLMRTIIFEEAGLEIQNEAVKQVPEEGGEISLEFLSNVETQVIIPENAQDWISLVPATKAMEYNAVTLQIEPNPGYYRSAEVLISSVEGTLSLTYTVEQQGNMGVDLDPDKIPNNEIWYVTLDNSLITINEEHTNFGANVISNTYDNGKGIVRFDADVTTIDCGNNTLYNSGGELVKIVLPQSITSIVGNPFYLSKYLTEFKGKFASSDGKCLVVDGVLHTFAQYKVEEYTTLPEIISIGDKAFYRNIYLKKIVISEGVTRIGDQAFFCDVSDDSKLEEVYLPSTLESVGVYPFVGCKNIKRFYGPSSIVLEDGMGLYIDNYNGLGLRFMISFASGAGLTSYSIPDGIEGIENYSFYCAEQLEELTIPESVVQIGPVAFEGTYNIERLFGPNVHIDGRSYVVDNRLLYVADKGIIDYTTPEGVELLGYQVFSDKQYLENLTISDEVIASENQCGYLFCHSPKLKTITISARMRDLGMDPFGATQDKGSGAGKCPSLEAVYLRAPEPPLIRHNFPENISSLYDNLIIYVPKESIDLYMSSPDWAPYRGYFESYDYGDLSEFYPDIYTSADYSADGTYELLQQATVGNGIDVVLMGDAYSDRLIADGTYRSVMENTMEQFFSEEPYKSFREYFNVYMVNVVSPNEVYEPDSRTALSTWFGDGTSVGGDDQTVFSYALNAISEDRMDEALIVVMMNRDYYAGTCWMYYPESGDYGNGVSVAYFPTSSDEATFRGLILHEAGGHGFAKLADEYAYEEYGQVPSDEITNCQNLWDFGWYPNIDFTSDPALVNWSEFIADARYQYDGLGVFEGGYTYWTGVWRPTENSIMRYNEGGFNAPSREAIYTRINKLAFGESWQYDYEDFVAYDAVNRRSEPATAPSSVLQRHEPTAPPVIVRKTWREALESSGQPEAHLKSR